MATDLSKLAESLSTNERKVLPLLDEKDIVAMSQKSNLDKTSVLRALEYLQNKKIIELKYSKTKIIELGVNGILYKKKQLPERRLMNALHEYRIISFKDAPEKAKISEEEFKAALGALKKRALVEIKNGNLHLNAKLEEITKKTLEEQFIESLPLEYEKMSPEQKFGFNSLSNRKGIIELQEKKKIEVIITELGRTLMNSKIKAGDLIEAITPKILKSEKEWKGKKFRRYDIESPVPEIFGGKRHFVNQAIDYARKIWTEMGFKEMTGNITVSSFWNFDALFTAQDHPVREMQDTFFIDKKAPLPENKNLIENIKKAHKGEIDHSKGWNYSLDEEESKKMLLRTHTTCISAQTLTKLKSENLPAKFFAIGKCFRNETIDWSHGFEFNQTEGIVIDPNANFCNLLGYLKQFYKKMGFNSIRFRPAYFPYTEPSVEIDAWHPERKVWLELGGAGIFRPEVTIPLLGKHIPILAWGPGFDRTIMDYYKIKDLRELYKNNILQLRKMKFWIK